MRGSEQRIDVDGLVWIDEPIWNLGLALQRVQQLPEPPLGSHLPQQRSIGPHPLGLAHGWLMLLGPLGGKSDGVERIDNDPLHVVFREVWHAYLLPFGNAAHLYHLF